MPQQLCSRSRKCSRPRFHPGRCNFERKSRNFWENSPSHVAKGLKQVEEQHATGLAQVESGKDELTQACSVLRERGIQLESFTQLAEERADKASRFYFEIFVFRIIIF